MLNIPHKDALQRNIDPADLEDLRAEAEAENAERRDSIDRGERLYAARVEAARRNHRQFGTDPSWYGFDRLP